MPYLPSTLNPTPDRGLRHQNSKLNPIELRAQKSGVLAVATNVVGRLYNNTGRDLVLEEVELYVGTAPTTQAIIVDVNTGHLEDAVLSAFDSASTRPQIAAAAKTGSAAPRRGTLAAPTKVTLPAGDYLTVDIDQVGTGTAGSDLTVVVTAVEAVDDSADAVGPVSPNVEPFIDAPE